MNNVQKSTLERAIFFYFKTENRRHEEKINTFACPPLWYKECTRVLKKENVPEHATLTEPVGFSLRDPGAHAVTAAQRAPERSLAENET